MSVAWFVPICGNFISYWIQHTPVMSLKTSLFWNNYLQSALAFNTKKSAYELCNYFFYLQFLGNFNYGFLGQKIWSSLPQIFLGNEFNVTSKQYIIRYFENSEALKP